MIVEPLSLQHARALARKILADGITRFSSHALEELKKDRLTEVDATNVIRAGIARAAEFENGSWRYRFDTPKIVVIIAFRNADDAELESELAAAPGAMKSKIAVVTAWRLKERN